MRLLELAIEQKIYGRIDYGKMDLFFVGKLKKKLMKPSEIKPEEEKEYYCVGEVPKNGIATYDQGYFLPREAFHSIISQQSDEIDRLKK